MLLFDVVAFSNSYNIVVCFLTALPNHLLLHSCLVVNLYGLSHTSLFHNYRVARQSEINERLLTCFLFQLRVFTRDNWLFLDSSIGAEIFFPAMKKLRVKSILKQQLYGPTSSNYFWFRYPHHFEYLETLKVEFYCSFDFKDFPFDRHQCDINFGSSGVSTNYLKLLPSKILYSGEETQLGHERLNVSSSRIPFKVQIFWEYEIFYISLLF